MVIEIWRGSWMMRKQKRRRMKTAEAVSISWEKRPVLRLSQPTFETD
jgi:hypothetical protein